MTKLNPENQRPSRIAFGKSNFIVTAAQCENWQCEATANESRTTIWQCEATADEPHIEIWQCEATVCADSTLLQDSPGGPR